MSCRYESLIYDTKKEEFFYFDSAVGDLLYTNGDFYSNNNEDGFEYEDILEIYSNDIVFTLVEYGMEIEWWDRNHYIQEKIVDEIERFSENKDNEIDEIFLYVKNKIKSFIPTHKEVS